MPLLSSGSNANGQLASSDVEDKHSFTPCSFEGLPASVFPSDIDSISQVACGGNHTLLLSTGSTEESHTLWAVGDNSRGQIGLLDCEKTSVFQRITLNWQGLGVEGYDIVSVASCWETSYLVLRPPPENRDTCSDMVISMGADDFGDLGLRDPSLNPKATTSPGPHIVSFKHLTLPSVYRVEHIQAGVHHVVAVFSPEATGESSSWVGWGASRHGQLSPLADITQSTSAPGVRSNGVPASYPRPVLLPSLPSLSPMSPFQISSIAVGQRHTSLIDGEHHAYAFGSNKNGQTNTVTERGQLHASVHCTWNGTYYYCLSSEADADTQDGSPISQWQILACGSNNKGQLGRSSVSLSTPSSSSSSSPSSSSINPQDSDYTPLPVLFPFNPSSRRLMTLACGSEHVLACITLAATKPAGEVEVWGWGWNEHGNLGIGHTEDVRTPVKIWEGCVLGAWAGCGTSWLWVDDDD